MYEAPDVDVPIFVHEADREQTDLPIAGTFSKREMIGDDLEVIPAPGHTPGTTMFLWDNGEHRLLFPGDSIWVPNGEWKAVLLEEKAREAYIASVSELMDLDFDILVPWGNEEGQIYCYAVTRTQAQEHLRKIVDRLQNGDNA
jgi:glyoxylase-like metal-dependent hydrolase (beta-lactamase superfamily II)